MLHLKCISCLLQARQYLGMPKWLIKYSLLFTCAAGAHILLRLVGKLAGNSREQRSVQGNYLYAKLKTVTSWM